METLRSLLSIWQYRGTFQQMQTALVFTQSILLSKTKHLHFAASSWVTASLLPRKVNVAMLGKDTGPLDLWSSEGSSGMAENSNYALGKEQDRTTSSQPEGIWRSSQTTSAGILGTASNLLEKSSWRPHCRSTGEQQQQEPWLPDHIIFPAFLPNNSTKAGKLQTCSSWCLEQFLALSVVPSPLLPLLGHFWGPPGGTNSSRSPPYHRLMADPLYPIFPPAQNWVSHLWRPCPSIGAKGDSMKTVLWWLGVSACCLTCPFFSQQDNTFHPHSVCDS